MADLPILASQISLFSNPDDHRLLRERISNEPLAMIIDENQSDWADVVRWVQYGLLQAEELGITQANIDQIINDNIGNDSNNEIRNLLGIQGNAGELLGLPNDYMVQVIKAVGNYGEIYDRHFDSDVLPRGFNELSSNFGLQLANPSGALSEQENITIEELLNTPLTRLRNTDQVGGYLYALEGEGIDAQQNYNFVEEGFAFSIATQASNDNLIAFNRFQNNDKPGSYLYATETESISIRQDFPNFIEEGIGFYALGAESESGESIFRLQYSQNPGTYIYVDQQEKDNIMVNLPDYINEGVAFKAVI